MLRLNMKYIILVISILLLSSCSNDHKHSNKCDIKDNKFINKFFYNTENFEKIIHKLIADGYKKEDTNEKIDSNHLNNIIVLRKNESEIYYVDGDATAFYAEITDASLTFYNQIKIGDSIHDFAVKSGHSVSENCQTIAVYDDDGIGVINFQFINKHLFKVVLDFDVP